MLAVFAGVIRSTAVTVTTLGPSSATGGAAISVVNMPAASACAAPVTSPAIVTGAPGVNDVADTATRWPVAKHVPVTVRSAAPAPAGATSSPATAAARI